MKKLVILRGIPNSGKTTFRNTLGLDEYTICLDDIRRMLGGTYLDVDGNEVIASTPAMEKKVISFATDALTQRLEDGSFTLLDCCNTNPKYMNTFIQLARPLGYRIYVVDMMLECSLETCLERNTHRTFNRISEDVIHHLYKQYKQGLPRSILSKVTVLAPSDFESVVLEHPIKYNVPVAVFGDVHGCYSTLKKALALLPNPCVKVFLGDYCDRGPDSAKVLKWVLKHKDDTDYVFVEGNHEAHLRAYSKDKYAFSKQFNNTTKPQLDRMGLSKKEIRVFTRDTLKEMHWFKVGDNEVFATHGGITGLYENPTFMRATDFIHGIGDYDQMPQVADCWDKHCNGTYQIHGHRNNQLVDIPESKYSLNVDGHVEKGGQLRFVVFNTDNTVTACSVDSIEKEVFKK